MEDEVTCKRKRGRPLKKKSDSGELYMDHALFTRNLLAVWAYQTALAGGKSSRDAIEAAIALIELRWPAQRISKSTLLRALRDLQPQLPKGELETARARLDGALKRGEIGSEEHGGLVKQIASFRPVRFLVDLTEAPNGELVFSVSFGPRPTPVKTPRKPFRFGKG